MPRVTYQVNVEDPCVWDYLFIAWHDTSKKLDDWKDVESAIKEWVIGKGSISLNDALNYWTILSVKPSRPDAVVNAYLKIQKYVNEHSSNIDFSVLNYFNTSADLDDEGSEDPVEILRVKLLDFFAKELHVIEDAFTRYLIRVQVIPHMILAETSIKQWRKPELTFHLMSNRTSFYPSTTRLRCFRAREKSPFTITATCMVTLIASQMKATEAMIITSYLALMARLIWMSLASINLQNRQGVEITETVFDRGNGRSLNIRRTKQWQRHS